MRQVPTHADPSHRDRAHPDPVGRREGQQHEEDHDRGLSHDLPTLLSRRRALTLFGVGVGAVGLAACSTSADPVAATSSASGGSSSAASSAGSPSSAAATPAATSAAVTEEIPEETGGPYPADGSNGVNVLTESGIVRSDITTSFGSASGVAAGVPLTVTLTVLDVSGGGDPLPGAAVYLWHCDQEGRYSLYSDGVTGENYLRGVQEADSSGNVTFTSVFPAAYDGRWPHIHFEIYPSLDDATTASNKLRTTQLALPEDICDAVYATSGYEASVSNMSRTSLDRDMVFSDGYSLQMAKVDGDTDGGFTATLNVPV